MKHPEYAFLKKLFTSNLLIFTTIFIACNSPIEIDGQTDVTKPEILLNADDQFTILELFKSPVEQELGLVITRSESPDTKEIVLYNLDTYEMQTISRVSNPGTIKPDFSGDGSRLAYITGDTLVCWNLANRQKKQFQLKDTPQPILRWSEAQSAFSYLYEKNNYHYLVFYDLAGNSETWRVPVTSAISDFNWKAQSDEISFVLPAEGRFATYTFDGNQFIFRNALAFEVTQLRWSPQVSRLNKSIGDYALIKGSQTFGVYFPQKAIVNWLKHLESRNITSFSWSWDGTSVIYVGRSGNSGPGSAVLMEQVIFYNK